jgi:hypothetical protein
MAPIPVLVSVRTNGDGSATRKPIFKSDFIKFERKFKRSFDSASLTDGFMISYAVHHAGSWPTSDEEFDTWIDSAELETLEVSEVDLKQNPTEEPSEPS